MKKLCFVAICVAYCCIWTACGTLKKTPKNDDLIDVTFLQINDVYEIEALNGGREGGMARVASLRNRLKAENPNTFAILAGDFLSPSVVGTLKYEDKSIKGRQMVEAMNAAGIDMVTFGNHEFDIKETELQERLNESNFRWLSSNIKHKTPQGNEPFYRVKNNVKDFLPPTIILDVKDADGTSARVGIIGVTLNFAMPDYARYYNADSAAIAAYNFIKNQTDFVIAITHQSIDSDKQLAQKLPQVQLIMGGHEHNNMLEKVGNSRIAKADANAKTAYIHRLKYNKKTKQLQIQSELKAIDNQLPDEPTTFAVVQKWKQITKDILEKKGIHPEETVFFAPANEPLEGREYLVRSSRTNLTQHIANAIRYALPKVDGVVFNSGSIRIDDQLSGNISQYDVLRVLPYSGKILTVELKGKLLTQVLEQGRKNVGNGGFLQYDDWITNDVNNNEVTTWRVGKEAIQADKIYTIAFTEFLLTGKEKGLSFLTRDNPDIIKVIEPKTDDFDDPASDIVRALIRYFKKITPK